MKRHKVGSDGPHPFKRGDVYRIGDSRFRVVDTDERSFTLRMTIGTWLRARMVRVEDFIDRGRLK